MVEVLKFIGDKLAELEIPYEFGEWSNTVSYPYFVGDYSEYNFIFENNQTDGTFTLDGWCRGKNSKLRLSAIADSIKSAFDDLRAIQDGVCFYITYTGATYVPTGEDELYRITITLTVSYWKGEN